MKLKNKVLSTAVAASLAVGSVAGLPLWGSLSGGTAYASGMTTPLPSSASTLVSRLNAIYGKLSTNDKATIQAARTELQNVWNDYGTAAWHTDAVQYIDPVWQQVLAKIHTVPGYETAPAYKSVSEDNLFAVLMHVSTIYYGVDYPSLESIRTNPFIRNVLNDLAELGGLSQGINDPGVNITDITNFALEIQDAIKSSVSSSMTLPQLLNIKTTIETNVKNKINSSTTTTARILRNSGITADALLDVKHAFEADTTRFPSLKNAEDAIGKAYVLLLASEVTSGTGDTGGTGGTGGSTGDTSGGSTGSGLDTKKADEILKQLADKLGDIINSTDNASKAEGLKKAKAAIEEAIRKAATIDLSKNVKKDGDKATVTIDATKLDDVFKKVKEIADKANKQLKDASADAEPAKVVATLDLGTTDAKTSEIPIPKDLLDKAKANGIDAIALKVNGVSLTVDVDQLLSDTTLTVTQQDQTTATNATQLPVVSKVYEFNFASTSGEKVENFKKPVEVRIPVTVDNGVDSELLTLAKIIDGKLIFFGGSYNKDNGELKAVRNSFSTYTVVENKVSFNDTVSVQDWAGRQIQVVAAKGIIEGRADAQFAPNAEVTRAEFAKMLVKEFGLEDATATESFSDVNASDWYQPYVAAAVKAGLVNGRSDTEFAPNATITRAEMATMAARALTKVKGYAAAADVQASLKTFADAPSINETLQAGVALAADLGVVIGEDGSKFNPNNNSTRAQAAVVIYRLLNK